MSQRTIGNVSRITCGVIASSSSHETPGADRSPLNTTHSTQADQTSKGAARQPPALSGPPSHHYRPASPHPASSNKVDRPTSDRHLADLLSEVSGLVNETVARITDTDVEEQLGRVLDFGGASPAPDRDPWDASREQESGGAHQGVALSTAPVRDPLGGAGGAGGPTVLRILLGAQLRRLREARGVTMQQAAWAIRGTESKISRIEVGRTSVREVDIIDLLGLYGISDPAEREELLTLAGQANQPGWWHQYQDVLPSWFQAYIGLEERTEFIRSYDAQFISGPAADR
jgi:transcriptional regulator with XRE-family HTH domain